MADAAACRLTSMTPIVERRAVDAYFCGPREMVTQLREHLARAGVTDERQVYERY